MNTILFITQIITVIFITIFLYKQLVNKKIIIAFIILSILDISTYIFKILFELRSFTQFAILILLILVILKMFYKKYKK